MKVQRQLIVHNMLGYISHRVKFDQQFDWNVEDVEEMLYDILKEYGFCIELSFKEEQEAKGSLQAIAEKEEFRAVEEMLELAPFFFSFEKEIRQRAGSWRN